jgi:hypothetical protein
LISSSVALILQINPNLKPEQIYMALIKSGNNINVKFYFNFTELCKASKYNNPDILLGYGLPNITKAAFEIKDLNPKKCQTENCNHNGECFFGVCYCNSQFYGSDCSKNINEGFIIYNFIYYIIDRILNLTF